MKSLTAALALAALLAAGTAEAQTKPNVLLIVADDLGYTETGPVTPNINDLAKTGTRLGEHYATAFCTPTRAAIQTGSYPERVGLNWALEWNSTLGLMADEVTIAERMDVAGYQNQLIGKWHLGKLRQFHPMKHGYDHFFGVLGGQIDHFTHRDAGGKIDWWWKDETTPRTKVEYATTALTADAIKHIRYNTVKMKRPWFMTLTYTAVHGPHQGPEGKINYAGQLAAMDRSVRDINKTLGDLGIRENTVIFFTSDNGGEKGHNGSLRGAKGTLWEGGIKVPGFVVWPGVIPAGRTIENVTHVMDFMPTITEIGGTVPGRSVDGRSLMPMLMGGQEAEPRHLFWSTGKTLKMLATRKGEWKLVRDEAGVSHLFNLANDPNETTNLAGAHPAKTAELLADIAAWRAEVGR